MPLKDLIKKKIVTCQKKSTIQNVADLMKDQDVGSVLITENEKPVGIVTDRDIVVRSVSGKVPLDTPVEQIMSKTLHVAKQDDGLQDLIRLIRAKEVRRIPVVDDNGKAVGLISFGDIVGLLAKELTEVSATTHGKAVA